MNKADTVPALTELTSYVGMTDNRHWDREIYNTLEMINTLKKKSRVEMDQRVGGAEINVFQRESTKCGNETIIIATVEEYFISICDS